MKKLKKKKILIC